MRLWSILTEAAWKRLNERGCLVCDDEDLLCTREFLPAYRWMMRQMSVRIGPPPADVQFPLWAWYQYRGKRKKPIARKHHLPKRQRGYRVECHLPEDQVLLSDYTLWHHVLSDWYLPESETEHDTFDYRWDAISDDDPPAKKIMQGIKETSWERILDLGWYSDYVSAPRREQAIQACFWRLELGQVRQAYPFVSR
jgi:hypothetical protein